MRRRLSLAPRALSALLALGFGCQLLAQEGKPPEVTFQSTELAPGLFMIEGVGGFGGGNIGLLTGADGVVLVDDSLPPLAEKLLTAIQQIAPGGVDFVLNTHVHGDHVGGNELFGKRGATIVAHDNVRGRLIADGASASAESKPVSPEALPVLTFADAVTFHLNGQEAYVFHVERAHTDGDAIIHFKTADVIHAGDIVFNKLFPFIDLDGGGSLDGFIAAQEKIIDLAGEKTRIIPGHGALATRADVVASVVMLKEIRTRIGKMIQEGKSVEEILAARPLADYEWQSWGFITTERMIRQVHREMSGD